MKKKFIKLLSALLIISMLPVSSQAEDEDVFKSEIDENFEEAENIENYDEETALFDAETDVAYGKTCFASWYTDDNYPDNITDGNRDTAYVQLSKSYVYVDLGKAYVIDRVEVLMSAKGNQNSSGSNILYLTNTCPGTSLAAGTDCDAVIAALGTDSDKVIKIGTVSSNGDFENSVVKQISAAQKENTYRYVLLNKPYNSGLAVSEIKVYANEDGEEAEVLKEIGRNSPTFASSTTPGANVNTYASYNANDGSLKSFWTRRGCDTNERFVMDLGQNARLRKIAYVPRSGSDNYGKDFLIYASNDSEFVNKDLIYKQPDGEIMSGSRINLIDVPEEIQNGEYRYIVAEGADAKTELAIAELMVYAAEDNLPIKRHAVRVSVGRQTYSTAGYAGLSSSNVNNNTYNAGSWASATADKQKDVYVYIDLGGKYTVPYVTLASGRQTAKDKTLGSGYDTRRNFKIVGTNDPKFNPENDVVLAEKNGVIAEGAPENDSNLVLFETKDEYKNRHFRYVGVRKSPEYDENGIMLHDSRADITMLDIYTDDLFIDKLKAEKNDNVLTIAFEALGVNRDGASEILMCYDSENKYIGSCMEAVSGLDYKAVSGEVQSFDLQDMAESFDHANLLFIDGFDTMNIIKLVYNIGKE